MNNKEYEKYDEYQSEAHDRAREYSEEQYTQWKEENEKDLIKKYIPKEIVSFLEKEENFYYYKNTEKVFDFEDFKIRISAKVDSDNSKGHAYMWGTIEILGDYYKSLNSSSFSECAECDDDNFNEWVKDMLYKIKELIHMFYNEIEVLQNEIKNREVRLKEEELEIERLKKKLKNKDKQKTLEDFDQFCRQEYERGGVNE